MTAATIKCADCGGPLLSYTAGWFICHACEQTMPAQQAHLTAAQRERVAIQEYEREQEKNGPL